LTNVLRRATPLLILLGGALVVLSLQMKKKEKTSVLLDKTKLRIPYARKIWTETAVSLFSRTLGLLLEAGITLLPSLPIASQAIPNKYLGKQTGHLPDDIRNGETLSDSLAKTGFFETLAIDMIRIGETSANLHGMLKEVADVYDERIQGKIDTFVSLIEPVVIIFMGMLVALMLLSVYLPIFNIIQITR
jgi:type II secretory pathway component PulF